MEHVSFLLSCKLHFFAFYPNISSFFVTSDWEQRGVFELDAGLIIPFFPQWNVLKYVCARCSLLNYSFRVDLNVSGCNVFEKPTSMVNICPATSPTWEVFSPFFRKVSAYFRPRVTRLVGCAPEVCLKVKKVLLRRLLGALVRAIRACWRLLLYKHMLRVDPPLIRLISHCLKH